MNDLAQILADLRRQRSDLEREIEQRQSRGEDISALIERLERLRDRIDRTPPP